MAEYEVGRSSYIPHEWGQLLSETITVPSEILRVNLISKMRHACLVYYTADSREQHACNLVIVHGVMDMVTKG